MTDNDVIQGLWIGPRLAAMQQLSIKSFLGHGHQYHLYTYADVANVPAGTILKDASEIVPSDMVFRNPRHETYAAFSDMFRYRMLLFRGGWWADLDIICVKRFDFASDYVFANAYAARASRWWAWRRKSMTERIATGVIKAPKGAAILEYLWSVARSKDPKNLTWNEIGPDLLAEAVARFKLGEFVQSAARFNPVPYFSWAQYIDPTPPEFTDATYALHLYHEMWRRNGIGADTTLPATCIYETLKRRYEVVG